MELILVVVISAGMAGNSQNGVSRSLKGAIVAKTTWAHWHTCSLLLNFTQHLCSMDIK